MNLRQYAPRIALAMLGFAPFCSQAHADTFSTTGNFTADNDVFLYVLTATSPETLSASTSSYAAGGFDPVLTLFTGSGAPVDNFGSGVGDAMLTDTLDPGTYLLALTEFPNVAIGTLPEGFLFASDPTATGDNCGVSGEMFLDCITGMQRTSDFALTVNTTAVTPEPSSWLLVLPGAALLAASRRRRMA